MPSTRRTVTLTISAIRVNAFGPGIGNVSEFVGNECRTRCQIRVKQREFMLGCRGLLITLNLKAHLGCHIQITLHLDFKILQRV